MQRLITTVTVVSILAGCAIWMLGADDRAPVPAPRVAGDSGVSARYTVPFSSRLTPAAQDPSVTTPALDRIAPVEPAAAPITKPSDGDDLIQLALLLDCSGSMDGLISQAQAYLWNIVNELSAMQRDYRPARMELALYAYGINAPGGANDYVTRISPFTSDLEAISAKLFALETSGSVELCGKVLHRALDELEWSENENTLRIMVIAGNESFAQGLTDFRAECKRAAEEQTVINTIFCGNCSKGVELMWRDAAHLAGGTYNCIDHNDEIRDVATPYDGIIDSLNQELNDTYIGYGDGGAERKSMQLYNDANTGKLSKEQSVNRAIVKSSDAYNNGSWDIVDAVAAEELDLEADEDLLPERFSEASVADRKLMVTELANKRGDVRRQIKETAELRSRYLGEMPRSEKPSFADALVRSLREQAAARGFQQNSSAGIDTLGTK